MNNTERCNKQTKGSRGPVFAHARSAIPLSIGTTIRCMSERGDRGGARGWKEGDVYNNIHAGGREEGGEEWAVGVLDERLMRCWQSRTCGREKRDDGYWNTGPVFQ